jgi:hypothetical protein
MAPEECMMPDDSSYYEGPDNTMDAYEGGYADGWADASEKSAEWTHDRAANMGYLKLSDQEVYETKVGDYVNVDIDKDGNVIGVEVFL